MYSSSDGVSHRGHYSKTENSTGRAQLYERARFWEWKIVLSCWGRWEKMRVIIAVMKKFWNPVTRLWILTLPLNYCRASRTGELSSLSLCLFDRDMQCNTDVSEIVANTY